MDEELQEPQVSYDRAIDIALWMTFKYRMDNRIYGIQWLRKSNQHQVVELENRRRKTLLEFPQNYSDMDYTRISTIHFDKNPLPHWEEIRAIFSSVHGETLRFLLSYEVPLEKLIRFALASRGCDMDGQWIGYEKAYEVWLK